MKHEHLKLKAFSDPDVKAEYDALEPEFAVMREMLLARCGKTVVKIVGKRYSKARENGTQVHEISHYAKIKH